MLRQQMVLDTHFLFILFTFLQRIILFALNKVAKLGWFVVGASDRRCKRMHSKAEKEPFYGE